MTREEFENAVRAVLEFWPDEIDVSKKIFLPNGSCKIQSLVDVHDAIEHRMRLDPKFYDEKTDKYPAYGGWATVIDWEILVVLWLEAKQPECLVIYPRKIKFEDVLTRCLDIEEFAQEWPS